MDITQLENDIRYYAEQYYLGTPKISDEVFDSLVEKLRQVKPDSYVLTTGWGFEVKGNKIKHKYSHIGSLDKTKSFDDFPERFKYRTIYISPKLDGLSAVAYYENGVLVKGLTRGNGEYGKDITDKLDKIIGKRINDSTFTGAVRGELIIHRDNWTKLQEKYEDLIAPRNFAAGIINRKDIDEDIHYIDFVVYKIVGYEGTKVFNTRYEVIDWLQQNYQHTIPQYYYPTLNEPTWLEYHKVTYNLFEQLGYGLDGLVLTQSDILYDKQTQSYIYDEVAFKFKADSCETTITDIEWTLSRTGRLVPVAVVDPVELSGAKITRSTCNNAKMVQDMGLGVGARVEIMRANEVIPQIVDVLEESTQELPTICPICGEKLIWVGVDLKCGNKYCPNIQQSDLQQWCEFIGETDGLQWTLMKQYLDAYRVTSIASLYSLKDIILMDMTTRQLSITETKVLQFFNKLYTDKIPVEKVLTALNIPRLGDKTSKLLSKNKELVLKLFEASLSNMVSLQLQTELLNLVKEATTVSIIENLDKISNMQYLVVNNSLDARLEFPNVTDNLQYVAVTGSLETMKRKDFEKYIAKYGYELSANLKKCKYLINNDITSTSTKNKQAKEYGIPIITEQEFLKTLN